MSWCDTRDLIKPNHPRDVLIFAEAKEVVGLYLLPGGRMILGLKKNVGVLGRIVTLLKDG